jgi:hypothetical protein
MTIAPDGTYAKRAQRELALIADRAAHPIPIQQRQYDATITRARALLSAKFYKEAVAEAASAQVIDDSRWESYTVVCLVMIQQNKTDEAARFRELALARTPQELKNKVSDVLSDPAK